MMRIGLISDTHNKLRPQVFQLFTGVQLILHAGDIGAIGILDELDAIAPVQAVLGNTDSAALRTRAQDEIQLELEGTRIVVVHGHQFGSPNADNLATAYPDADVIVYGHTHRQRVDRRGERLIVNPGAAGAARFDLKPAVAILELERGAAPQVEHFTIG